MAPEAVAPPGGQRWEKQRTGVNLPFLSGRDRGVVQAQSSAGPLPLTAKGSRWPRRNVHPQPCQDPQNPNTRRVWVWAPAGGKRNGNSQSQGNSTR